MEDDEEIEEKQENKEPRATATGHFQVHSEKCWEKFTCSLTFYLILFHLNKTGKLRF